MGKRRRRVKKASSKPSGTTPPVTDMAVDCVQYASENEATAQNRHSPTITHSSESSEASDEEMQLCSDASNESDVQLSVEFFDPRPADTAGIQRLLHRWGDCARHVAEAIVAQTRVGTVVRVAEGEEAVGVISCLNIRTHEAVISDVLRRAKQKKGRMQSVIENGIDGVGRFERERVGLIICERVVNMPGLVISKMLEALFCEIEWAVEDEKSQKDRESYRFGWFLYVTDVLFVQRDGEDGKRRKGGDESDRQMAFTKVEDEIWMNFSSEWAVWDVGSSQNDAEVPRKKMGMIIAASKVQAVRDNFLQLLASSEQPSTTTPVNPK